MSKKKEVLIAQSEDEDIVLENNDEGVQDLDSADLVAQSEDEELIQSDPVVSNSEYRVYKSLQQGLVSLPIIVKDKFGNEVKKYVRFNKNTLRTNDLQEIAELDRIYEEDRNLPVKNRRVLSQDEFLSVTSPDSLYVEVDGEKIHISQVREAVKIARANGWTPTETEVIIINNNKSKIIRGGTSAGIGGI
ncbi:MAG TPA: hypothetical protein PL089_14970 [Ignavibacteria bacterium]|nr:hypothetical protein [Ignavibacteria bacterium]